MAEFISAAQLRHEVWIDDEYIGRWNGGDLELGGETTDVRDPELGSGTAGGRQTGGDIELSRPWARGREKALYAKLLPKRNRATAKIAVFELDEYDQPVDDQPIVTYLGRFTTITKPEGSADSDDSAVMTIGVRVNP